MTQGPDLTRPEEKAESPDDLIIQPVKGAFNTLPFVLPGAVVKEDDVI